MTGRKARISSPKWQMLFLVIICIVIGPQSLYAQNEEPGYDEIEIFLEFPGIGGSDIAAVIKDGDLYLPVATLFNLFKIRNVPDNGFNTITGFFLNPESKYVISREKNSIDYQGKTYKLDEGDIVRTEYDLFLRSDYYGKIFGLECFFNFRNLSVTVKSKLELPLLRELKQEQLRKNLSRLKGEMITDTTIKRSYPLFRFGMADWSVISEQNTNGRDNTRLNLSLGAMLGGGEATASIYYNSFVPFSEKTQQYMWRYVDNDFSFVRQIIIGKAGVQSTASLFNPVLGFQLTNAPTTYRRSFGTYTITDRTEPDWMVELYVNNVLIDYVKADASGFFKFDIPLVYGNSLIQLKFFGPWGEEKVKEQNINIPYSFIPEKTLEYKFIAGVVEDSSFAKFSRLSMNYGVTRRFTLGGGFEYLSSVTTTPVMPYVSASLGITNNLLLSGEYTHNVKSRGTISFRTRSNVDLEATYVRYVPGQKAIIYNYLEERRASVSIPFRLKNFSSFNRFSFNQFVVPSIQYSNGELRPVTTQYSTANWLFSGSFRHIASSISTQAIFIGDTRPNIYSNLSFTIRAPANILMIPQVQYGYTLNSLISSRFALEKRIKDKAFLNASIERNFINDVTTGEFGVRYNFSFGQTGASVRRSRKNTSFVEHARGSIIHDSKTNFLKFDNKFNVGRGGISFIPFVDLNANGRREAGEPKAFGLNLKCIGGYVEKDQKDTTIRILGLEPYTKCFVELDQNSFENISWKLPYKVLGVMVDPDIVKHLEIPVVVVGEASGNVVMKKKNATEGIGRILVNFFSKGGAKAGSTLTEDDGYFTLFGLTPGEYYVRIDSSQLAKLGMQSDPVRRNFSITAGFDGDIIDGLDFSLRLIEFDTIPAEIKKTEPVIRMDTTIMIVHEIVEELVTITKDSWAIQLGAFKNRTNAETLRKRLEQLLGRKVDIVIQDGYFKVRINEIPERKEVDRIVEVLRKNGITEIWIITLKAKQQQVVMREREDSVMQVYESKIFLPFTDDFYNLDRKPKSIIDQTVIERMESHPDLKKPKFRDIKPLVRIMPVSQPESTPSEESIRMVRGENLIEEVNIPRIGRLAIPVVRTMSAEMAPDVVKVPEISLQVGVYYKKSEALKAQRKIMTKLNLPVKIIEQWEYFRVIITGFHSREETFMYYPELAGLGFPAVKLIEE